MQHADSLASFLCSHELQWDPHHMSRLTPKVLMEYKRQLKRFTQWYTGSGRNWHTFWQFDMLLVNFQNDFLAAVGKGDFATLVAATEFVPPWAKGQLLWSRAVLEGWPISGPIHHALPMPDPMMIVIVAVWWMAGFKRHCSLSITCTKVRSTACNLRFCLGAIVTKP